MTIVFLRMASIYRFWPSVLALIGFPFAVMHRTSRLMVCTSASRPSRASPITYCTVCVPIASPRAAMETSASMVCDAVSTSAASPEIFSSVPRLTTETPSSRSISLIFSSNAPKTDISSSVLSTCIVFSMVCTLLSLFSFRMPLYAMAKPRLLPAVFSGWCCHRLPRHQSAQPHARSFAALPRRSAR